MKNSIIFPLIFIFILIVSCNESGEKNAALMQNTDSTYSENMYGSETKLVKTGSVKFKVHDVANSMRDASILSRKHGGIIFNQTLSANIINKNELAISADSMLVYTTAEPTADMIAKVPSENLEDFLYDVAGLGYFTFESNYHITDESLKYLDNSMLRENRNGEMNTKRGVDSLSTFDRIQIKDVMTQQLIANKQINADVKYSTVSLSLFQNAQVHKEYIPNYHIDDYQLPLSLQLSNALSEGWNGFMQLVLLLSRLWVLILIMAVFLYYKKESIKKLIGHY